MDSPDSLKAYTAKIVETNKIISGVAADDLELIKLYTPYVLQSADKIELRRFQEILSFFNRFCRADAEPFSEEVQIVVDRFAALETDPLLNPEVKDHLVRVLERCERIGISDDEINSRQKVLLDELTLDPSGTTSDDQARLRRYQDRWMRAEEEENES